ncbi:competence protein CoiA family protein [Vibrio sp. CUB2]|uniref:competence protein CoiA family protein n=1 Tax=Vibrio sp. CUB2 TaxID=2315233 RepID=UPI00076A45FA|nr:competence protein CoiA family protein [Vibrio sp. CUB2]
MFLSHGVNEQGDLVSIHEVSAGRVPLSCPFCGQGLIAKKGSQKEHHFAHDSQTCADAKAILQMTALPLFDVDMGLSKTEITLLEKLSRWRSFSRTWLSSKQRAVFDELVVSGLVDFQEGDDKPRLSKSAKQLLTLNSSAGRYLSMPDYAELQEALFVAKEKQLIAHDVVNDTQTAKFFRLRLATILQQHLYVLRIRLEQDGVCYPLIKVGMTTRSIEERTPEICRDLEKFGRIQNIEALGFFHHFGSLEKRLLKLMQPQQHKLGSLTEYSDLLSIPPHLLNEDIRNLGKRKVNGHECAVTYRHHQRKIRGGQRRSQLLNDQHLGRPSKKADTLLEDYPDVVRAHENGLSLRKASAETGRAVNTIRKVYDVLKTMS